MARIQLSFDEIHKAIYEVAQKMDFKLPFKVDARYNLQDPGIDYFKNPIDIVIFYGDHATGKTAIRQRFTNFCDANYDMRVLLLEDVKVMGVLKKKLHSDYSYSTYNSVDEIMERAHDKLVLIVTQNDAEEVISTIDPERKYNYYTAHFTC